MIVRRSREYTLEAPKTLTVYLLFVLFDWFVYFLYVFLISCCHKIQVKEIIVGNGRKRWKNEKKRWVTVGNVEVTVCNGEVTAEMSNWPDSVSWFPELQLTNWNGNCNCNSSRKNRLNGSGNGNCDFQKMSHSPPIPLQFTLQFYLGSMFLEHFYSVFPPTEILDKNATFKTPSSRVKKTVDVLFFFNTWVFET